MESTLTRCKICDIGASRDEAACEGILPTLGHWAHHFPGISPLPIGLVMAAVNAVVPSCRSPALLSAEA